MPDRGGLRDRPSHVGTFVAPAVTARQMREVDRLMVESAGVSLTQMMENAGRSLADLALDRFSPESVTVLAGAGSNGGGGIAAARHLVNRGVPTTVVLAGLPPEGSVADAQLTAAVTCGVEVSDQPSAADLVIDALVGYGLAGDLRGRTLELARWALDQPAPVLALDVPTGLDASTGRGSLVVDATATLTLALPKTGLLGSPSVGELYLADISVPRSVYRELGLTVPDLFRGGQIVRLGPDRPTEPSTRGLEWTTYLDAARLILSGATFVSAVRIALVVGTLLTVVNLGGVISRGDIGVATVVRVLANFAIPYVVSSLGMLARTRRR